MLQICLTLSQFQGGVDTPMLKVTVDSVGTQLTLRSFDLCIDAFVGAVCLQHLEFSRELSSACLSVSDCLCFFMLSLTNK